MSNDSNITVKDQRTFAWSGTMSVVHNSSQTEITNNGLLTNQSYSSTHLYYNTLSIHTSKLGCAGMDTFCRSRMKEIR